MGYACTHDVPTVDDTLTINGREVMKVTDVASLAGCGIATVYRAIDCKAFPLLYRGLVDAKQARVWAAWWAERKANRKPRRKRPARNPYAY